MCLRRAPEKYIAGAALDGAGLYTTRIKCIITLLLLHVSALLGHHQVTNVYNYDIKDIPYREVYHHFIVTTCFGPLGPLSGD
jgi:hypothetical protein